MNPQPDKKGLSSSYPGFGQDFRFFYFSELVRRPIVIDKITNRIGKISDLVFGLDEPYPEAVGIYVEHGWGKPTEFVTWDKVVKIEDDAIFIDSPKARGGKRPASAEKGGDCITGGGDLHKSPEKVPKRARAAPFCPLC